MKASVSQRAPRLVALLAFAFATLSVSNLSAQNATVTTVPVGAVGVTIAAGTGTSRALSTVSFPLLDEAVVAGQGRGAITSVTAATISNTNAGWTAGQLSTAATPSILEITSGAAAGRKFLLSTATANTATTVTIDPEEAGLVNLTTLNIAAGDTYRILAGDTLNSIFGGPAQTGVLANTTAATSDNVQVLVGTAYRTYFHNGTQWVRSGLNTPSNNVAIRPDSIVIYSRLASSAINLTLTGSVPSGDRTSIIRNSGLTTLATWWPTDRTILSAAVHTIPGWVNGSTGDTIQVLVGTAYRSYYYSGTQWQRVGLNTASNTVAIPVGSGLIINKKGSATGSSALTQTIPYTL